MAMISRRSFLGLALAVPALPSIAVEVGTQMNLAAEAARMTVRQRILLLFPNSPMPLSRLLCEASEQALERHAIERETFEICRMK